MTTPKQVAANQQNSLASTGPKSPEGKRTSSHNAIRHGIFSEEIVITKGEVQEKEIEYQQLLSELQNDLKPEGRLENILVEKIAVNYWRMRRLLRYETGEVRQLLDEFVRKYIESDLDDDLSGFSALQQKPPRLLYFNITDAISSEQLEKCKRRVEFLETDGIDFNSDPEAIHFVLENRLRIDPDQSTVQERAQAGSYLGNLSPQQKGKIKRELLTAAKKKYEEIRLVLRWQKRLEIIKLVRSIPVEGGINKVVKYESALERSIFKNLAMLKQLQDERKKART